jgi:hypothetical protein
MYLDKRAIILMSGEWSAGKAATFGYPVLVKRRVYASEAQPRSRGVAREKVPAPFRTVRWQSRF